jgi:hypothetical protein
MEDEDQVYTVTRADFERYRDEMMAQYDPPTETIRVPTEKPVTIEDLNTKMIGLEEKLDKIMDMLNTGLTSGDIDLISKDLQLDQ